MVQQSNYRRPNLLHTSVSACSAAAVLIGPGTFTRLAALDQRQSSISPVDFAREQSFRVSASLNKSPGKASRTMFSICRAFCKRRPILMSIGLISQIKTLPFFFHQPSCQKPRRSGIKTPKLFRGIGKPNRPARVGAMSDCSTVV